MNIFEFILALLGMIIIGFWGTLVIAYKCGLMDNDKSESKTAKKGK